MKDTNINLGINNSECIKEQRYFFHTGYQNICNGNHYDVPNGSVDNATSILMIIILTILVGMMLSLILSSIRNK